MAHYPFTRRSPAKKIDYSYSAYGGSPFLNSYISARTDAIKKISSFLLDNAKKKYAEMTAEEQPEFIFFDKIFNNSNFVSRAGIEGKLPKSYSKYLVDKYSDFGSSREGFMTEEALKSILLSHIARPVLKIDEKEKIIDHLRKRYEVFQRIFSRYDSSGRKASGEFNDISNYALLGIIAADIYKKRKDLKYLNLVLKINDLLSQIDCGKLKLIAILLSLASLERESAIMKFIHHRGIKR